MLGNLPKGTRIIKTSKLENQDVCSDASAHGFSDGVSSGKVWREGKLATLLPLWRPERHREVLLGFRPPSVICRY